MNALDGIRKRHVERKSFRLYKDQPGIEADGYRHWCAYCKVKWPCDAARLLVMLDSVPA